MKKVLKWIGIVIGSLLGLIVLVILGLALKGNSMLKKTYDLQVETIPIPTDEAAVARGEHWVMAECIGCHGEDLSGAPFFEAPFATVNAKNLTTGKGGIGSEFTDEDWVRVFRHGIGPDGNSILIMPSHAFRLFSDADLGDIIAYLKVAPPVDKELSEPNFNLLGKALLGAGVFGDSIVIAETINNNAIDPVYPPAGVTPEYGQYLINVSACRDCHGAELSGGKSADPSAIYAPNLTSGGELIAWKEEDFIKAIRTGLTPTNRQLDPLQMPWEHYKNFSDDELKAIWAYLESLPRLESTLP
ncbi:MAG: cytochrome c [Anaerolineales bacterium]|nr:cytochrome c [Anaerolineales bacterium]